MEWAGYMNFVMSRELAVFSCAACARRCTVRGISPATPREEEQCLVGRVRRNSEPRFPPGRGVRGRGTDKDARKESLRLSGPPGARLTTPPARGRSAGEWTLV